jgi:3-oxoacyl-[acyl-carrier-protein] synthase III
MLLIGSRTGLVAGNLRDKFCIVGVEDTEYSRGSGRTTRALAVEAVRHAMGDAGLSPQEVDGLMSYHGGDSTPSTSVMYDLGIRPKFYVD